MSEHTPDGRLALRFLYLKGVMLESVLRHVFRFNIRRIVPDHQSYHDYIFDFDLTEINTRLKSRRLIDYFVDLNKEILWRRKENLPVHDNCLKVLKLLAERLDWLSQPSKTCWRETSAQKKLPSSTPLPGECSKPASFISNTAKPHRRSYVSRRPKIVEVAGIRARVTRKGNGDCVIEIVS
mgnify:CR=1 FL=1